MRVSPLSVLVVFLLLDFIHVIDMPLIQRANLDTLQLSPLECSVEELVISLDLQAILLQTQPSIW